MSKVLHPWIFWALLTTPLSLYGQTYYENREAARLVAELEDQLEAWIAAQQQGAAIADPGSLKRRLERLEHVLRRDAANRLDLTASAVLEAEARNELLFEGKPSLPPEDKQGGNWSFRTSRFEIVPDHLYIFSLKLKGSRTIRLRSVTLLFRDGGKIVHDGWKDLQRGNGQAFSKRGFTPYLPVYGDARNRRARALKGIEILGSAQDGAFSAELEFVFQIPEPQDIAIKPMLDLITQIRQSWDARTTETHRLKQCLKDLSRLGEVLKTKFGTDAQSLD